MRESAGDLKMPYILIWVVVTWESRMFRKIVIIIKICAPNVSYTSIMR